MTTNDEHMERLTTAGQFCLFDTKLRSTGKSTLIWGVLNALIGAAILASGKSWGAISLLLGFGLIAAGVYQRKVRHPKVIVVSAATLAVLAVWNFALVVLASFGKVHLVQGGRTLFWAIAQAIGAYTTWKTFSTYKELCEKSDSLTVAQIREDIQDFDAKKPDVLEFEMNAGFVKGTRRYRLKPVDELYLVAEYKAQFRSLRLENIRFVPRKEVTLTSQGEKWMSKKIRATVQLGPETLNKVSITPDMAARISPGALASGALAATLSSS